MSCSFILQIKTVERYFYFWSATFWCGSVKIWYLKLFFRAQSLEAVIYNQFKKSNFKDLKFLKEYPQNFPENVLWNQTFLKLFIAISFRFLYNETMHTLRNCLIWLSFPHSKQRISNRKFRGILALMACASVSLLPLKNDSVR